MRAKLPGINTVTKRLSDGRRAVYYYHRASGLRLAGKPGSPEFIASYAAAEKLGGDRLGGTFNDLVRLFTLSPEFAKRAASTQAEYRRMLAKAEKKFGDMPMAALNDRRVRADFQDWRASSLATSGAREGDNRLAVISAMLTWAVDNGRLEINALAGFKRLYHADRSELIWLPEQIDAFMKSASIEMQRAMLLALHTGQRQADLLRLPWTAYDGQAITLRQGKSARSGVAGPAIVIPCTAALRRMLDGMREDRRRQEAVDPKLENLLILTTSTGRPWLKRYFAHQWEAAAKAAGIADLHFHDLRGTAVTMLSEAGCTPQQVAAITGHSLRHVGTILDRYLARTRSLAEQAIYQFENDPRTKFANQMQTEEQPSRKLSKKIEGNQ